MESDIAIKVENVSKKYCKLLRQSMIYGVHDILKNSLGLKSNSSKLRKGEFWALKDIGLELKKGEALGVIGPNGSGKTTFLKLLNGIFWPDSGKISIRGKVSALIEVGAGFHPLLTGRENIYINGAVLGMNKQEINKKFDAIIDFADIGDFLDTPVKFYSSGMFVRLGFSIAVHSEPDVLLIDEILAVGDVLFQNKCLKKIAEMRKSTSIVLVSHNINSIQLMTDKCILLMNGQCKALKKTTDVLDIYSRYIHPQSNDKVFRSENFDVSIINLYDESINKLEVHNDYKIKFVVKNLVLKKGLLVAFSFLDLNHNYNYRIEIDQFIQIKGNLNDLEFKVKIKNIPLPPGTYTLRIAISDGDFLNRILSYERTIVFKIIETKDNPYFKTEVIHKSDA